MKIFEGDPMKTKKYRYGKYAFKSYFKKAGLGYEIGFSFENKPLFVGNFIHSKEANDWWKKMNTELKTFTKRFWITDKAPKSWYKKFLQSHLYHTYYTYLDKAFTKYTRDYQKTYNQEFKKYKKLKKDWNNTDKCQFVTKRAA